MHRALPRAMTVGLLSAAHFAEHRKRMADHSVEAVDAALSAGYADQSHFTREVRELMGDSPCSVIPNVGKLQDAHAYAREY